MATRNQMIKLGIFVTVFGVLFVVTLIVFAGLKVWEKRDLYTIYVTESVSGLEVGAAVKLRGVRVGSVQAIVVDPESVERVRVDVELVPQTPIKVDSRATLQFQGITGLKYIEITDGTAGALRREPGGVIPEGETALDRITGRAETIGFKAEQVLNNLLELTRDENRRRVEGILDKTDVALGNLNRVAERVVELTDAILGLIRENRAAIRRTIAAVEGTAGQADRTLAGVESMVSEVRQKVRGLRLEETVDGLNETNRMVQASLGSVDVAGTLERVTATLAALQLALGELTKVVGQNQGQLRATMNNLRTATESLKEFGRQVEQQPSRLIFDAAPEPRELP